jgi:hypothetical protein
MDPLGYCYRFRRASLSSITDTPAAPLSMPSTISTRQHLQHICSTRWAAEGKHALEQSAVDFISPTRSKFSAPQIVDDTLPVDIRVLGSSASPRSSLTSCRWSQLRLSVVTITVNEGIFGQATGIIVTRARRRENLRATHTATRHRLVLVIRVWHPVRVILILPLNVILVARVASAAFFRLWPLEVF